jgi:hypothetical protein
MYPAQGRGIFCMRTSTILIYSILQGTCRQVDSALRRVYGPFQTTATETTAVPAFIVVASFFSKILDRSGHAELGTNPRRGFVATTVPKRHQ